MAGTIAALMQSGIQNSAPNGVNFGSSDDDNGGSNGGGGGGNSNVGSGGKQQVLIDMERIMHDTRNRSTIPWTSVDREDILKILARVRMYHERHVGWKRWWSVRYYLQLTIFLISMATCVPGGFVFVLADTCPPAPDGQWALALATTLTVVSGLMLSTSPANENLKVNTECTAITRSLISYLSGEAQTHTHVDRAADIYRAANHILCEVIRKAVPYRHCC